MGWQELICAACSGLVVDGRCPVCRAAREEFRSRDVVPAQVMLVVLGVLAVLLLLVEHLR